MKSVKFICIMLLIFIPLFSDEFKEYKLEEKQQFEGNKIFDEMVLYLGNIESVKTIRTVGTASQLTEFGTKSFPVHVEVQFPDKIRLKFEDKEFIIDQKSGWLKYPQGFYENLSDNYIETISGNLKRNLIHIAKNKSKYEIMLLGEREVQAQECQELELMKDDNKFTLFIDIQTQLPVQIIYLVDSKQIVKTYLEYKIIDGINYPVHTISTDSEGNLISEIELEQVEFNVKIEGF